MRVIDKLGSERGRNFHRGVVIEVGLAAHRRFDPGGLQELRYLAEAHWADSTDRRNTQQKEVALKRIQAFGSARASGFAIADSSGWLLPRGARARMLPYSLPVTRQPAGMACVVGK